MLNLVLVKKNGINSLPLMFHIKLTKSEHAVFPSYSFILWYHKLKDESHETDKSGVLSEHSLCLYSSFSVGVVDYNLLCWIRFN